MEIVDRDNSNFNRRACYSSKPAMAGTGCGATGGKERKGESGKAHTGSDHHRHD